MCVRLGRPGCCACWQALFRTNRKPASGIASAAQASPPHHLPALYRPAPCDRPQVQFNLADFVKRAYGTNYVETLRVQVGLGARRGGWSCGAACRYAAWGAVALGTQMPLATAAWMPVPCSVPTCPAACTPVSPPCPQVHANCRIRRIYFSDRLYSEAELPPEFKVGGGWWVLGLAGWLAGWLWLVELHQALRGAGRRLAVVQV